MARPKILCPACSNEIQPGSKFCSSCGTSIDWDGAGTAASTDAVHAPLAKTNEPAGPGIKCPLCGIENAAGVVDCTSCGAALPGAVKAASAKIRPATPKQSATGVPDLKPFQSWKLIVAVAVLLVCTLVGVQFFKNTKSGSVPTSGSPTGPTAGQMGEGQPGANKQDIAAIVKQIDAMQKQVDDNPNDPSLVLHLANALQDAHIPDRAIDAYKKYLALKPDDANAIVDMGVCYYEMAGADSTTRGQNLVIAREHFEKALGMDPHHQMAMFNLGIVSLMTGDLHVATQWFKKTVAADSTTDVGRRANMLLTQHSFENKPTS